MRPLNFTWRLRASNVTALQLVDHGGCLFEQRDRDLEHAVKRIDADALVRLMVALGTVSQVRAGEAGGLEGVCVRGAAGRNMGRLVSAGTQRAFGERDVRGRGTRAIALEHELDVDVEVALG